MVGLEAVPDEAERVVVLSGDTPLIDPETIRSAIDACSGGAGGALVSARLAPPHAYGRIVREGDHVARIVEARDASARGARARRVQRRAVLLPARRPRGRAAPADGPERAGRALPDRRDRAAGRRRQPGGRGRRAGVRDGRGRQHPGRAGRARGRAAPAHPPSPHAGRRAHRRSRDDLSGRRRAARARAAASSRT